MKKNYYRFKIESKRGGTNLMNYERNAFALIMILYEAEESFSRILSEIVVAFLIDFIWFETLVIIHFACSNYLQSKSLFE